MAATESSAPGPKRRFKDRVRDGAHAALRPVVRALASTGLKPDHLTWLGLLFSIGSGFAFFDGHFKLGASLLTIAGLCDILDGELARHGQIVSRFGAFLDSTLDRVAEAAALLGIAGFALRNLFALVLSPVEALQQIGAGLDPIAWPMLAFVCMLALLGSFMVSYTRARAEGLGIECKVGWFERPERMVLLIVAGYIKWFPVLSIGLTLLAVLSLATAAQRVAHVHKLTRRAGLDR
jgi:CDP-diacylglycerol--glycerol-3-phosphate 3-phosphatidyltransferase